MIVALRACYARSCAWTESEGSTGASSLEQFAGVSWHLHYFLCLRPVESVFKQEQSGITLNSGPHRLAQHVVAVYKGTSRVPQVISYLAYMHGASLHATSWLAAWQAQ